MVFPFPKVFRLIRNGSTSRAPPLIIDTDGNFDDIIVYSLAIALLTPSPFCVTCLSRLAFEYCRQRYLCTLVIIDPPSIAYTPFHIGILISSLVSQDCSRIYTIAILVCASWPHIQKKKENKLLSKRATKKLVSKNHSIASYDIILDHFGSYHRNTIHIAYLG